MKDAGADLIAVLGELVAEVRELRREVALFREAPPSERLLTVAEKAAELGRSHDWIRAHRDDLGAVAVGNGPKPRLYFPPGPPRVPIPAQAPAPASSREFPRIRARR